MLTARLTCTKETVRCGYCFCQVRFDKSKVNRLMGSPVNLEPQTINIFPVVHYFVANVGFDERVGSFFGLRSNQAPICFPRLLLKRCILRKGT